MFKFLVAAACTVSAAPVLAQDIVSANDPATMVKVLEFAGYEAELSTDSQGDPLISTELAGYNTDLVFYGCNEDTHDECDAIQFYAGFKTDGKIDAVKVDAFNAQYRYAQASLDEDKDMVIRWDVLTGKGIPTPVFLMAVRAFAVAIGNAADTAFPD